MTAFVTVAVANSLLQRNAAQPRRTAGGDTIFQWDGLDSSQWEWQALVIAVITWNSFSSAQVVPALRAEVIQTSTVTFAMHPAAFHSPPYRT